MTRVKRGVQAMKTRRKFLKLAKGFQFGRSTKERQAKVALYHAGNHAFAHRRRKKSDFRRLWSQRINAAVRPFGLSYSKFIHALNQKSIGLNRKMLATLAKDNPDTFKRVVEATQ